MRGWETGAMTTSFPVFAAGPLNQVITMAPSSRFGSRVNMFVFICVYLYIYLPVYMRVSAALHECLFVCLFVFVSIFCLSVRLPVCLFAYLSVSLSFCQKCRKGIPSWLVFICFTSAAIPIHSCISNMSPPLGSTKLYGCIMISVLRPIGLLTAPSRASESQASCPIAIY